MKHPRIYFKIFILFLGMWLPQEAYSQTITWTGKGDGKSWSDATNWNTNALPLTSDLVLIGGDTSFVQFDLASATVAGIIIEDSADLTLRMGTLSIDNQDAGTAISLGDQDSLVIDAGASLHIFNATDAIEITYGISYLINSGTITFGPNLQYDGIWVNFDGRLHLHNTATGIIQTSYAGGTPNEGAFINVDNASAGYSTFNNEGTMQGTAIFASAFYFVAPASLYNSGTLDFQFVQLLPVFELNFGSLVHNQNTGIINIGDYDDTGINLNFASTFINDGAITSIDNAGLGITASEAIDLDDANSTFVNTGMITITGNEQSESIEIDGKFENSGFLNVGNASAFESIKVRSGGEYINHACGVVNITSNHLIGNSGIFTNDGILTTVFTGTNLNLGLFTNNNTISTSDGLFTVTPNAITNTGSINSGPIPSVTSECSLTCPVFRNVLATHAVGDTLLQASDSLETVGTVQIANTQTVTFQANQSVTLSPGFSAANGSFFVAKISGCEQNPVSMFRETATTLKMETPIKNRNWLKVSPNPLRYDGQIEFSLKQDSRINLSLWNSFGQQVAILYQGVDLSKGVHRLTLQKGEQTAGIYFLHLASSEEATPIIQKILLVR